MARSLQCSSTFRPPAQVSLHRPTSSPSCPKCAAVTAHLCSCSRSSISNIEFQRVRQYWINLCGGRFCSACFLFKALEAAGVEVRNQPAARCDHTVDVHILKAVINCSVWAKQGTDPTGVAAGLTGPCCVHCHAPMLRLYRELPTPQ